MDIWSHIERLMEAEGLKTEAALARSLRMRNGKSGTPSLVYNVRNGIRRFGTDIIEQLADRMTAAQLFKDELETLRWKDACRNMPLRSAEPETTAVA